MVFKLGIRLLNMETPKLSPSAAETRRGFFFLITTGYGCGGGRDQRGSCWRRIVVTKLGTTFAYRKSAEEPRLVLRRSRIPPTTDSLRSAFRAKAWQAANAKARELGWIV